MRLSDVKGERVFDAIADIIKPIANIAQDESAAALFKREKVPDGMTAKAFLTARLKKVVPALLKEHKEDLIAILAAIEGETAEEYAGTLTLAKLISDVTELLTDDAFKELFTSAQSGTGGASSASARENTGEAEE